MLTGALGIRLASIGSAVAAAAATALLMWAWWTIDAAAVQTSHAAELARQASALRLACEKSIKLTEDSSNAYQNQLAGLQRDLANAKRVRPAQCVPVAGSPSGRDAATGNSQLPRPHGGVASTDLLDFAGDCEQVGRQLDACQKFVNDVWEGR